MEAGLALVAFLAGLAGFADLIDTTFPGLEATVVLVDGLPFVSEVFPAKVSFALQNNPFTFLFWEVKGLKVNPVLGVVPCFLGADVTLVFTPTANLDFAGDFTLFAVPVVLTGFLAVFSLAIPDAFAVFVTAVFLVNFFAAVEPFDCFTFVLPNLDKLSFAEVFLALGVWPFLAEPVVVLVDFRATFLDPVVLAVITQFLS